MKFDGAEAATVRINRERALFEVRLIRRRKVWTVSLDRVVQMVVWRLAWAEAAERTRERKAARKRRAQARRRGA
jgi:hypothetical protein